MRHSLVKAGLSLLVVSLLTACGGSGSKSSDSAADAAKGTEKPAPVEDNKQVQHSLITDTALRACVTQTGVKTVDQLQILECTDSEISSLAGLEQFQSLVVLNLSNNNITDLQPVAALKSLASLSLNHNEISTVASISPLKNLKTLSIAYNKVTEIAGIEEMQNLKKLYADNNQIADLNPVVSSKLEFLVAHDNPAPLPNGMPKSIRSFRI